MRFLPLVLANLLRKKARTALTAASFAIALFLFCILVTIRASFNQGVDAAGADRIFVTNRTSLIQPLPLAYRDQILKVPGVQAVSYANWFGGVYQDPKNFFPQFAVDKDTYREMYREFRIDDAAWQSFQSDRTAAIAGAALARRFGWKVGDRIPIQGAIFAGEWNFLLVGIYEGTKANDDLTQFWFRWDYLNENLPDGYPEGYVGWYSVRMAAGADMVEICRRIDERFANSAWETRAQSEKAMAASFVKQMGNIETLMLAVGSVVVFTLLLVTGNTMAGAVRERTSELAVLKAIGYGDRFVLGLVLAESLAIAVMGGALGAGLAKAFTLAGDPTGGMLPVFYLPDAGLLAALGLSVAVGLFAGFAPALAAMRLEVATALRRL
ncbi:MAG: ABC transporter permease [Vicinamibacteria bacterium]|nr:ABC transporter permease [Vicinamibacteria bacterium]